MRCRKVRSFLSTYFRGETTPDESAKIERHLEECGSCRRELEVHRSLNAAFQEMPTMKTSDDFNARLFAKIGQENFAEKKTKAYMPGRVPRFGTTKLATYAAMAVIVLALGIGLQLDQNLLSPSSPQMANGPDQPAQDTDMYLTAQPVNNPLMNARKSVGQVVQQYNRFREYSKSLRTSSGMEQLMGDGINASLASSGTTTTYRVRPVVRNYLVIPENNTTSNAGAVY
ncbi:MAG: zf-HC2 domain-containing protein [Candidatus Zixiibacteriota bacterium]